MKTFHFAVMLEEKRKYLDMAKVVFRPLEIKNSITDIFFFKSRLVSTLIG